MKIDEEILMVEFGALNGERDPPVVAMQLLRDASDGHSMSSRENAVILRVRTWSEYRASTPRTDRNSLESEVLIPPPLEFPCPMLL